MRKMAYQAKDAVFLVLFLVCLNVIYNSVTTDATTFDTSTTNTNTTPNPSSISCISDKFTSPFVTEDTLSISSVEESVSWSDQLSDSSMISNLDGLSSFSNLIESEHSSISYTTCILLHSDNSRSSDLMVSGYSSILYSATILSISDNPKSSDLIESEFSSIPYTTTILSSSGTSTSLFIPGASFPISSEAVFHSWTDQLLHSSMMFSTHESSFSNNLMESKYSSIPYSETMLTNSDNSTSSFIPGASFSISSEAVFHSWTDQLLHSSMMFSTQESSFSNNLMESKYSSIPYSKTILTNSDNSTSSFILEPSHSISSEESSQLWTDQLSISLMFLSTQEYSLVSSLIGSQYSSIQHTTTDLLKNTSSCILHSCETSVHILPTSAQSVTYLISSRPTSALQLEVSPSFKSVTNTPFSSSQRSAFSSVTLTKIVTAPTSSTPTSTLQSEVSSSFNSITNTPVSSSQRSAFSSVTLTNLVTAPTSSTPISTLQSEVSLSFRSITNTPFSSSQRSAFSSVTLTKLATVPTSSTSTSTLQSEVSSSFNSITNTPFSSSQRSAFSSVTLTNLVTAPTSSTPISTLPSEVFPSFKSITNTPFSSSPRTAIASVASTSLVTAPTSSTPTKQTTSTVGETVMYPTFKALVVYEFTFVFVLDGDFIALETRNQKDQLKKQLEQQLMEKIFKDTELTEIHVLNFSQGSIVSRIMCRGQVKNVNRSLEVILNNTVANARSINTSFGDCDVDRTIKNITSSIDTYMAHPEQFIQYDCPKSYNYHEQDGKCHHVCDHKGIEFCGSNGECVFSGTENVAVCQCSEESLYIYHGDKCEQKTPKLTFYLAVSLGGGGGVVIILLITIICLVCRRIRLKKSLKAADDDSERWSLPNEHVAMRNLSFRLSKKPASLYYRPTGQVNKAYESIAPDDVIMPMYFPPERNSSNSRHEDDTESRRESLKNIDTSQKYSILRPKVSMEPNDLYFSVKGPRI